MPIVFVGLGQLPAKRPAAAAVATAGKPRLKDMVDQATSRMGERIVVKRFARFQVGES